MLLEVRQNDEELMIALAKFCGVVMNNTRMGREEKETALLDNFLKEFC